MTHRTQTTSVALLVLGISVSSAAAGFSASSAPKVTSSLDGKSVLPHKIRWVAQPGLRSSRVAKVQFLIDGKLRWVEKNKPYVYGDDRGKLVTSWLKPGKHSFTVRVVPRRGAAASHTTKARVLPSPLPPAELRATTWKRTLSKPGSDGSPKGTWTIRVTDAGWKIDDPMGGTNFIDAAYLSGNTVELGDGIWTKPRSFHEGNGWCPDTNRPVRYQWAVAGDSLTLTLSGKNECGDQSDVIGGAWTRAG